MRLARTRDHIFVSPSVTPTIVTTVEIGVVRLARLSPVEVPRLSVHRRTRAFARSLLFGGGLACPALPSQDQIRGRQPRRSSSALPQGINGRCAHALSLLHRNEKPTQPTSSSAWTKPGGGFACDAPASSPERRHPIRLNGSSALIERALDMHDPPPPTPGACSHRSTHTAVATSTRPPHGAAHR